MAFKNPRHLNRDLSNKMVISPDSTKVAFFNPLAVYESEDTEQVNLAVFDAAMNLVWEKKQSFQYPDNQIYIMQSAVVNNGDLYLLAKIIPSAWFFNESPILGQHLIKKYM